ncbi:MAG TPA: sodium:solute symporter [Cytophagales bacterium]|nr:sodium:solute symporter [Cytophagales bacterium]HAA18859.1 sodium:solute symporter [Cytophagales bacterium]
MNLASDSYVLAISILVALYAGVILFFVIRGALRIKSMQDYAVGNVNFSPVAVGLALAASMTSAATFIINPGFIGLYGISGVLSFGLVMPLAIFVSLILFTKGFRKMGQTVKATTMAQWMGQMHRSKGYALFFAVLSLLLITFIVLICVGLTQVLSRSLNADPQWILAALVIFIFGYMMFGGANSMVYTNAIQAVLMAIVAVILLTSGYEHFSDGVSGFFAKLEGIDPLLASSTNPESFLFRDYFEIIFCQAVIGIAIVCQPHIITKSLLLKSDRDVNRYLGVGIGVLVLFFLVVFAGLFARLQFPDMTANGEAIPMDGLISAYVVARFPVYVGLVVVLGLLSAGLSTLEGLIQSLSSTITTDLIRPVLGKRLYGEGNDRREMVVNKGVIVVLAVASFFLSRQQLLHPNLSVGIFAQNGVYAYFSAAFVPVLFGMFFRQASLRTVWIASGVALLVHFGVYYGNIGAYMQEPVNNPAIASTFALLSSVAVGLLLYFVTDRRAVVQLETHHA